MSAGTAAAAPTASSAEQSLLGPGSRFEGLLAFHGDARLDGELNGEIQAEGRLEIGPDAKVSARVAVDELVVAGTLEGDVVGRKQVQLLSTARVVGTLHTPRLAVAEGARFEGRWRVGPGAGAQAPALPETAD